LTPEQAAVWSYPLQEGDDEEVVFNMVNALLLRVHQSGHLAELNPRRKELVKEGLDYYKTIRSEIPEALPFWPWGLPTQQDEWIAMGLRADGRQFIAVWRARDTDGNGDQPAARVLDLPDLIGRKVNVQCAYPLNFAGEHAWDAAEGKLSVTLPAARTARLFEIRIEE